MKCKCGSENTHIVRIRNKICSKTKKLVFVVDTYKCHDCHLRHDILVIDGRESTFSYIEYSSRRTIW